MRLRLSTKFTAISCGTLLVIMVIFALIHVEALKESFFNEAVYEADTLSEMLQRATYYQMLEDDRTSLQQSIDEAGTMERIKRIRIFGRAGLVNFSSDRLEIGTALDDKDEGCIFCHVGDVTVLADAPARVRSRVFADATGAEFLGMSRGIYNEKSCYVAECHFHSPEEKILGILDIVISLEKMTSQVAAYRTNVFSLTFAILVILSVFLFLFMNRIVSKPLNELLHHTKCLARGDLETRIESWPRDELGELCESFNQMASSLAQAQVELRDWGGTLELKVEERTAEIKDMQNQLVQSAKLASMGELVAGIAHEINNPLGGILMFSSLSSKTPNLPQQVKENLEVIVSETKRCAKIVSGLLEFSRESIPEKREESINQILEQTMSLVFQQSLFQNIEIQSNFCEDLPVLYVDPDQLQQVFFNILINAGQAMPEGGVLRIETALEDGGKTVIVRIEDSGQGIQESDLVKIFDPFFSTKTRKGFGLGLSVSYGIIKNHGGQIYVQSQVGEGTRFTIYLPIETADALLTAGSEQATKHEGDWVQE